MDDKEIEELKEDETTERFRVKEPINCTRDDHYFTQTSGLEVECNRCPIGFQIGPGTECRNGHLFIHGEKVL